MSNLPPTPNLPQTSRSEDVVDAPNGVTMDMGAHRGVRGEGGGERKTHAKAQAQQEMAMRRGGALDSRAMIPNQRARIGVGKATIAIQSNEK
eukprot:7668811-Prorocentrum_lima.AAC.1